MDKEFMCEYMIRTHEDLIAEAVEDDDEYKKIYCEYRKAYNELDEACKKFPDVWERLDMYICELTKMMSAACTDVYLLGADDREKMLK